MVKGPVPPVMVTLKFVELPVQILAVPEITEAVGPGNKVPAKLTLSKRQVPNGLATNVGVETCLNSLVD